jgi:HK97 family phage major capsid protein/HK97 family phage prohead protease
MAKASETIKTGKLYRSAEFDRAAVKADERTVELSFSSEEPVQRFFGFEILDHGPGSADLSRLNAGGALLVDHDTSDQVGVVERAEIGADRRGRAKVRFGNSTRANEIFQDVKDGIRRLVSVGYRIRKMVTEKVEEDVETLRAMSWTPLEISLVSVPADITVGVGRANDKQEFETIIERKNMNEEKIETPPKAEDQTILLGGARDAGALAERKRVNEINAIALRLRGKVPEIEKMAREAAEADTTVEQFRSQALAAMPDVQPVRAARPLDVSPKDLMRYSITRAINRHMAGKMDGIERELDDEMTLKIGSRASGFWLPGEVLAQRSFIAGTGTLGGMIVSTPTDGSQFVEMLRNRAKVAALGARIINLDSPVQIPRQAGAGSSNWVGETVAATLSTGNFEQITLTPLGVSAFQQYGKQLLATSNPSIDTLIRDDINMIIGLAVDKAALHGSGGSQPTGLAGTTGVNTVALSANALALGNATAYPAMVSLETLISSDNADVANMAYLMNAAARGSLKGVPRFASTDTPVWEDNQVNGYRAEVTQQIATNLTTGTATTICTAVFFGDWNQLIIAQFNGGATDLVVDPFTLAANGVVRIIARRWVDIAVRHPEGFAILGGIL